MMIIVRKVLALAAVVAVGLGLWILGGYVTWDRASSSTLSESDPGRPSITFILGEDNPEQVYFQLAQEHFTWDAVERTDQVIKSCRSLSSMITYLNTHRVSGRPWGVIQVVLHGNMWSGLSVPMWDEGPRAYPKDLLKAVHEGRFPVLAAGVVDTSTKINFWACGIGKQPLINLALRKMLRSAEGQTPKVYTSPHFVIFKEVAGSLAPKRIKASYWPYIFRRGYRPSESLITQELRRQFPEAEIDWRSALQTEEDAWMENPFQQSFHVPVVWTVLFDRKEDRPSVSTAEEKMQWVRSQPGLMQKVADLQIPLDKYNWTVNKIKYRHPDGSIQPAIKAIGMSTVLCVLQPE